MIINTGQRTDIPAFYSRWFVNRLKAGFVLVRNPYNPHCMKRQSAAFRRRAPSPGRKGFRWGKP